MGVDGHQPLSRAKKYAGPMLCVDLKVLGLATQWSFCAMLEIEALLLDLLQHRAVLPADLNVAILAWGKMGRLDLSSYSNLARWLDNCLARPAYGRVRDRTRRK